MNHFLKPLLRAGGPYGLRIERSGSWLATELDRAFDSASRKQGLLGRERLDPGRALVIAPTQGIHTFGMPYPLDVVAVARDGCVVKMRPEVPPRRLVFALKAFAFIELAPGSIDRVDLREGDRLAIATSLTSHS